MIQVKLDLFPKHAMPCPFNSLKWLAGHLS
jgi:hypothetical protein